MRYWTLFPGQGTLVSYIYILDILDIENRKTHQTLETHGSLIKSALWNLKFSISPLHTPFSQIWWWVVIDQVGFVLNHTTQKEVSFILLQFSIKWLVLNLPLIQTLKHICTMYIYSVVTQIVLLHMPVISVMQIFCNNFFSYLLK